MTFSLVLLRADIHEFKLSTAALHRITSLSEISKNISSYDFLETLEGRPPSGKSDVKIQDTEILILSGQFNLKSGIIADVIEEM